MSKNYLRRKLKNDFTARKSFDRDTYRSRLHTTVDFFTLVPQQTSLFKYVAFGACIFRGVANLRSIIAKYLSIKVSQQTKKANNFFVGFFLLLFFFLGGGASFLLLFLFVGFCCCCFFVCVFCFF